MIAFVAAVLLSFTDPQGDAYGDGSLQTPTAAVSRTLGSLDVTNLELYEGETLSIGLTFASLTNPFQLPNGFSFPIIEVYIDNPESQGADQLLPGSDMQLPAGADWNYAFKVSGDAIQIFEATEQDISDISSKSGAKLTVTGNTMTLQTSLPRPESLKLYAIVGNYSPFIASGWMPTSASSSPWAYWSESQISPVVEVVAPTVDKQIQAIQSGVLPPIDVQRTRVNPWFFVMFGGLLIALLGIIARFWVKPAPQEADLQEVWVEEDPGTPSEVMASQRLKNQPLAEVANPEPIYSDITLGSTETFESKQDTLDLTETHPENPEHSTSPAHSEETESSAKSSNPNLFDIWVEDEADPIDWASSGKSKGN